jgi:RHS repeat-associated protein
MSFMKIRLIFLNSPSIKLALFFAYLLVFIQDAGATIVPDKSSIYTAPFATQPLQLNTVLATSVQQDVPTSIVNENIHNRVTLSINRHYKGEYFGTVMDMEVELEVKKYLTLDPNESPSVQNITLHVYYDPFSGEKYISSQSIRENGYRKIEVEVIGVNLNGSPITYLPKLLVIDVEIISVRPSLFTYPALTTTLSEQFINCDNIPDAIKITWSSGGPSNDQTPLEYQLEWFHINDYGTIVLDANNQPISWTALQPTELAFNFKFNSTRISTINNFYEIPLIFDRGYIVFRVRAVGLDINGNYVYGPWTFQNNEGTVDVMFNSNSMQDSWAYYVTEENKHNPFINWTYRATYAELGKRKDVISYYDGTLRNRQTVTRINSNNSNNIIVGEVYYDHYGRPAVSALPAPAHISCPSGYEPTLQYYPNFNLAVNGLPYSKYYFDVDSGTPESPVCDAPLSGLSIDAGSGRYYSHNNPEQFEHQAYVPNSAVLIENEFEAFPIIQTEFTADMTGRVRRQGGVGHEFQLNSGHETRYMYVQPTQVELNRMFGSEVGYAKHYQKMIVVDAHGQASISYVDQEGRVIATALAGDKPLQLEALESLADAEAEYDINAFNQSNNSISINDSKISFNTEIAVSKEAVYGFTYSLSIDALTLDCIENLCFSCVYDLKIKLIDECGVDLLNQFVPSMVGNFEINGNTIVFHPNCDAYSLTPSLIVPISLPIGSYTLIKELTLNDAALQSYLDDYFNPQLNSCILTYDDFVDQAINLIDFSDCEMTCDECLTKLGSVSEFVAKGGDLYEYQEEYQNCQALCQENEFYSFCDISFNMMVSDMLPEGQYGKVYNSNGVIVSNANPLSVYNFNNFLPNNLNQTANWRFPRYYDRQTGLYHLAYFESNGDSAKVTVTLVDGVWLPSVVNPLNNVKFNALTNEFYVYPQHLSNLTDFIQNMDINWAKSLVYYHPEFCAYLKCSGIEDFNPNNNHFYTSQSFDELLLNTETLEQAIANGLITELYDPNAVTYSSSWIKWGNLDQGQNIIEASPKDPFAIFNNDINTAFSENTCFISSMNARFNNYATVNNVSRSMPEFAAYIARCGTNDYTSFSNQCFQFGAIVPVNMGDQESIRNREWEILRSLYLSAKQEIILEYLDCASGKICNTYSGCIGNENHNPFDFESTSSNTWLFFDLEFLNPFQPCGLSWYQTFGATKVKRFSKASDVLPNMTPNEVAYNLYLQTGQCPVPFALQNALTELAENNALQANITNLLMYSGPTAMYVANNNFAHPGTIPNLSQSFQVSGNTLTLNWYESNINHVTITLTQIGSSPVPWADLNQFINLTATGPQTFTVQGYTSNLELAELTGTISLPFELSQCFFNPVGTQNTFGSQVQLLLNALSSTQNLTTNNLNLTPLAYQNQNINIVGSNILSLFDNNTQLQWQYAWNSIIPWQFTLKSSTNACQFLHFNFTNPPAINPSTVLSFSNLVSTGQHTFSVVATTATQTYTLNGTLTFHNCGDVIGIPVGSFDLPTPILCQTPEHKATQILIDVLTFSLKHQDISGSINLFSNPFMGEPLSSQFYPSTYTTSSLLNNVLTLFSDDENCDITVEILGSGANLNELISVNHYYTTGTANFFGNYTELILDVSFDNLSFPVGQIKITAPCLNLKSCNPCPDLPVHNNQNEAQYMQSKIASGEMKADKSFGKYDLYVSKVDAYNSSNSLQSTDSAYIIAMDFRMFLDKGYHLSNSSYVKFLEEMTDGIDDEAYLRDPDKFTKEYGPGTNVLFEYERYKKAVLLYNDRADSLSLSSLQILDAKSFAHARIAKDIQLYIDYLQLKPHNEIEAIDVFSFFELDSNQSENLDHILYSLYVDAYFDFIEDSINFYEICVRQDLLPTLFAFEDFNDNYLFCSEEAKDLVLDYINRLEERCIGDFPKLETCDVTEVKNDFEEQRFYVYYLSMIQALNQSVWAIENNYEMKSEFKSHIGFLETNTREMIINFANHLDQYIKWELGFATIIELPQELHFFTESSGNIRPKGPCQDAYLQYQNCYNNFRNYIRGQRNNPEYANIDFDEYAYYTNYGFVKANLCHCVDEFCAQLQLMINGVIPINHDNLSRILGVRLLCKTPCQPNIEPQLPLDLINPELENDNPCKSMLTNHAMFAAMQAYQEYYNAQMSEAISIYKAHCLNGVVESLRYTYEDKQYHYTLYYYDQAGNLIKTIPPAGVELLETFADEDYYSNLIALDRQNNTKTVFTAHRLATRYEYNSLNQLVAQRSPDMDMMNIFEPTLPNGLPALLETNKIQMIDEATGYLAGSVNGFGVLFKTTNGGSNWSRVHGIAGIDFRDILMVDFTLGYAVGAPGLLFETNNGGEEWVLQNIWGAQNSGEVRSFNALSYGNNIVVVVGEKGLVLTKNNGTWSMLSNTNTSLNFTDVAFYNSQFYITANHEDGYAQIYAFDGINTLAVMTDYRPTAMNSLDVQNNVAYLAGNDGRIFVSTDITNATNEMWIQQESQLNGNIQQFVAFNEQQWVALVDNKIWRTMDAGIQWFQVGTNNYQYIHKTEDGSSAIAVGQSSSSSVLTFLVPNASGNTELPNPQHLGLSNNNAVSPRSWHQIIQNGNQSKSLVVYVQGNTLFYSQNGLQPQANWSDFPITAASGVSVVDMKLMSFGSFANPQIRGVLLMSDGTMRRVHTQLSTVVSTHNNLINDAAVVTPIGVGQYRVMQTNGTRYNISVPESGAIPFPTLISGTASNLPNIINQSDILYFTGTQFVLLGDDLYRFNHTSNITAVNITNKTAPSQLHAIQNYTPTSLVAVGNNGVLYRLDNGIWKLHETGRKQHFYALHNHQNQLYTAGENGHFSRGTISNGVYQNTMLNSVNPGNPTVSSIVSQDFYAIGTYGNYMFVVGQSGKIAFSPNPATTSFSISSMGQQDLYVVAPRDNGQVLIGGNLSALYSASSPSYSYVRAIRIPALRDVHFSDVNTGYIIGDNFTVRKTNSAGGTWSTVVPDDLSNFNVNFDLSLVHTADYEKAYFFGAQGAAQSNGENTSEKIINNVNFRAKDGNSQQIVTLVGNNQIRRYEIIGSGLQQLAVINESGADFNAIAIQGPGNVMAAGNNIFKYYSLNNLPINLNASLENISGVINAIDVKGFNVILAGENGKFLKMTKADGFIPSYTGIIDNFTWTEMSDVYLNDPYLVSQNNHINIKTVAIVSATHVLYGGLYTAPFYIDNGVTASTINYPFVRRAYDPGRRYSARFFYDKLGRLVVSQNARQYNVENGEPRKYSYTVYDALGRVIEVGEKTENEINPNDPDELRFRDIFGSEVSGLFNPNVIDDENLNAWIAGNGFRNEVTRSYYDAFNTAFYANFTGAQDNQRKRISHVAYYELWDGDPLAYEHATHFVYDIHGNVKKLIQDNNKMGQNQSLADQRFKTTEYSYDLISGNVHRVSVQTGQDDQWHHAYTYDDDNRIEAVYTSTQTPLYSIDALPQFLNNELTQNGSPLNADWQLEARYFYYDHGPLARTEIGDQLQGLDYIYNLQGWLKGVNATSLDNDFDPGKDGTSLFSKDVMAYSLHYYQGDYTPIGGANITPAYDINYASAAVVPFYDDPNDPNANEVNLYNGNIRFMQTTLTDIERDQNGVPLSMPLPMLNAYKYDQLNRLVEARSYTDGLANNEWNPTALSNKYHNSFTYDANGNILTQERRNSNGDMLDDLTYRYQIDGNGKIVSNRLYHVNDTAGLQNQGDLSQQYILDGNGYISTNPNYDNSLEGINTVNNYKYDGEGRLIRDLSEGIDQIVWRVDGKVKAIYFTQASNKNNLEFDYDAFGRRIAKHEYDQQELLIKSTYYILDAAGNLMNTYVHNPDEPAPYELTERVIYGSSRLGMNTKKADMLFPVSENVLSSYTGEKLYEMTNHLGNVLTVINDIKVPYESGGDILYYATIVSTSDYSPFGVTLDMDGGRTQYLSAGENDYRYGFNGYELDSEIKGSGNSYTTEYRQYDPRLARWLKPDPLVQFIGSQYTAYVNNPIKLTDPNGGWVPKVKQEKTTIKSQNGKEEKRTLVYLVVQKEVGDNPESLAKMLSIDIKEATVLFRSMDYFFTIKVPDAIAKPINEQLQYAHDHSSAFTRFSGKNYNCWASTIYTSQGKNPLEGNKTQNLSWDDGKDFTRRLLEFDYINVSETPDEITFGRTALRLATNKYSLISGTYNVTTHGCIFLGKSRDGTEYVFTKNGWYSAPKVQKLSEVTDYYDSFVQGGGVKENEGGYYNFIGVEW